jgi:DNA adenine methylase
MRKNMTKTLNPMFKWTGGKRREIQHFAPYYPDFVKNNQTFEPFAGAGATFWALKNTGENILNDYDYDIINFYRNVKTQNPVFLNFINEAVKLFQHTTPNSHNIQEKMYYDWRNKDRNNGLKKLSNAERAARFYIVNQLAFSGMRRFNAAGEFNVPYGHYKNLNNTLLTNPEHINLLKRTTLTVGDYNTTLTNNDKPNTFIFIDPPYTRVMKTYSADNNFGDNEQHILADNLKNLKNAQWMIIIDKSLLTTKLYKNYIKHSYPIKYGVNIKNRFNTDVEHLIATNY